MRKIGGLIAVVLMALLVIVGCDNNTVTNDGNDEWINHVNGIIATQPDTSWFDKDDATPNKTYELTTANELYGLMELVNGGEAFVGDTINLAKGTYDFTQVSNDNEGEPSFIGFGSRKYFEDGQKNDPRAFFQGKFNGNGAVIKGVDLSYPEGIKGDNLTEAKESDVAVGFFGVVKGTGTEAEKLAVVENLVFEDCTLFSTSNTTGIAVGYAENAIIRNITVKNCKITGPQGVGGVVGRLYNSGEISGCEVIDTTIAASDVYVDYEGTGTGNYNAGGIVGCASSNAKDPDAKKGTISVTENTVTLAAGYTISAADKNAAGICGNAGSIVTFTDNEVTIAEASQINGGAGKAAAICAGGSTGATYSGTNTITIGEDGPETVASGADDDMSAIVGP